MDRIPHEEARNLFILPNIIAHLRGKPQTDQLHRRTGISQCLRSTLHGDSAETADHLDIGICFKERDGLVI